MRPSLFRVGQVVALTSAIGLSAGWIWNAHRVSVQTPEAHVEAELDRADASGVEFAARSPSEPPGDGSSIASVEGTAGDGGSPVGSVASAASGLVIGEGHALTSDAGRTSKASRAEAKKRDREKSSLMMGMFAGGASSGVFGPGGLGTGNKSAIGGLVGGYDAQGFRGDGGRGVGAGNGGLGLGLGGLETRGGYQRNDAGTDDSKITMTVRASAGASLPQSVIEKVVKRHLNEISFCVEATGQNEALFPGKVAFNVRVDGYGKVLNGMESTTGTGEVGRCVRQRIFKWRFPEPDDGEPLTFSVEWAVQIDAGVTPP